MIAIYKISFIGCERIYIGQSVNVKNRIKYHRTELKRGKHYNKKLQRAYNKYGVENMRFDIIKQCCKSDLDTREVFYIKKFDSFKNGLNNCEGGAVGIKPKTKIYQYCCSTGNILKIHYGFKDAGKHIGVCESNIRQVCDGKMKKSKGFHFSKKLKTKDEVINDIVSYLLTDKFKDEQRKRFTGLLNPMFGKKRPDISGKNNPYRKMIAEGYKPKKRIKISEVSIVQLYKTGVKQSEIARIAGCTQSHISTILRSFNVYKFRRKVA